MSFPYCRQTKEHARSPKRAREPGDAAASAAHYRRPGVRPPVAQVDRARRTVLDWERREGERRKEGESLVAAAEAASFRPYL